MQEAALLMQTLPSKKRGFIWLLISLIVLGVAGFFAYIFYFFIIIKFLAFLHSLLLSNILDKLDKDIFIFFTLLGVSLLAYIGVWYGAMLIAASYKKYSFKKTRILALALSIGTFSIALLTFNLV
jgi:hypothetical protein